MHHQQHAADSTMSRTHTSQSRDGMSMLKIGSTNMSNSSDQ
jgi:hypothetical protein